MTDPTADGRIAVATWLADPSSAPVQRAAESALAATPRDPLAAANALRRAVPHVPAARASAALEQAGLRRLATERYGLDAGDLLLTRDGLEQATRPEVAGHRARLLAQAHATRVLDLTGGLGFDARAFLTAGLAVTAVERDPVTAVFLAHNCPLATVVVGDARDLAPDLMAGLAPLDAVFADPARRDPDGPRGPGLRARPERDPGRWSPPWPFVEALPHPRIAAKVAASFRPPAGWCAEWTSVERAVVECAVYSWEAFPGSRRAVVWAGGRSTLVAAEDVALPAPAERVGAWVAEPDPAVVRAGALAALLRQHPGLAPLAPGSTWLSGEAEPAAGSLLRSFAVVSELSGSATAQRRQLDRLGVAGITVRSRDVSIAPSALLAELGRREGAGHVLVVTRRHGRTLRLLCRAAAAQPG